MKNLILTLFCIGLFSTAGFSQCPKVMPAGTLCITQQAANEARDNAVENPLLKEKIRVLEASLIEKDKNTAEVQATADRNIATLKEQNTTLLADVANKTGQISKCESFAVRDAALIEFLVKNQRSKQNGVINIKLGGN